MRLAIESVLAVIELAIRVGHCVEFRCVGLFLLDMAPFSLELSPQNTTVEVFELGLVRLKRCVQEAFP